MAETRRCFSDHLSGKRPTSHGQFSCPEADAWHRPGLRLDAMTVSLPTSMSHGWDEPLDCAFVFKEPLSTEQRTSLEAVSVKLDDGYGPIEKLAHGTVALSHLYCLAELGIVAQLECEQPGPVLQ